MGNVVDLNIIELLNSFFGVLCLIKLNDCLASSLSLSVLEDADMHNFTLALKSAGHVLFTPFSGNTFEEYLGIKMSAAIVKEGCE